MTRTQTTSERISANVRAVAGRHKISKQGLAARSGIEYRTICRLWNAEQKWSAEQIEAVAAGLGIDWLEMVASHEAAA